MHKKPTSPPIRKKQCKACPWRRDVKAGRDIPGGYCRNKHADLKSTIAEPGVLNQGSIHMMACHEARVGKEYPCVGWFMNQLGPGNNSALRLRALDGRFNGLETVGEQWDTLEQTLGE